MRLIAHFSHDGSTQIKKIMCWTSNVGRLSHYIISIYFKVNEMKKQKVPDGKNLVGLEQMRNGIRSRPPATEPEERAQNGNNLEVDPQKLLKDLKPTLDKLIFLHLR